MPHVQWVDRHGRNREFIPTPILRTHSKSRDLRNGVIAVAEPGDRNVLAGVGEIEPNVVATIETDDAPCVELHQDASAVDRTDHRAVLVLLWG